MDCPDLARVAVLIVTWNSASYVTTCLDSVRGSTLSNQIWAIDNASSDGSTEILSEAGGIRLLPSKENLGFAGGVNALLKEIMAAPTERYDYALLLNPDARLHPTCIAKLAKVLDDNPQVAIACPVIFHEGSNDVWYAGADIDWHSGETPHRTSVPVIRDADFLETGRPCGAAMMIRIAALETVGPLDDAYFLYFEETDLGVRLLERGWVTALVPGALAWHAVSSSTGGGGSPLYHYYLTRSRLYFLKKFSSSIPDAASPLTVLFRSVRLVVSLLPDVGLNKSFRIASAIGWAFVDHWRRRYGRSDRIALRAGAHTK